MIGLLFFILLMVGMGQSFYSEEGCEVKSKWTTDFKVFDTYISAWVPSGENSTVIMEIEIEFENKKPPLIFDIISVYQDGLTFIKVRDGKKNGENNITVFSIADGWAEFLLTIDSDYNLKYLNKETDLLHGAVDYVPKSFSIRGSNITLYCRSKLRRWTISEDLVTIPLAGVEEHRLTLMSKKEFSPTIILEGRDRKLGWNSGHLTMIPSKSHPLPPFQHHHLNISCQTHRDIVCTMKFGKEIEDSEKLHLREMPTSISVKGSPGDNFFVLLHQNDPISTPNTVEPTISTSNTVGPNVSETAERFPSFEAFLVTLIICIVVFIILGVICYKYYSNRKTQEDGPQDQEKTGQTIPSTQTTSPFNEEDLEKRSTSSQMNERNRDLRSLPTDNEAGSESNSLLEKGAVQVNRHDKQYNGKSCKIGTLPIEDTELQKEMFNSEDLVKRSPLTYNEALSEDSFWKKIVD